MLFSQLFTLLALDVTVCLSQKIAHISDLSMAPCPHVNVNVDLSKIHQCQDQSAFSAKLDSKSTNQLFAQSSRSTHYKAVSKTHLSSPSTTPILASIPPSQSPLPKKLSAVEILLVVSTAPIIFAALLSVFTHAKRMMIESQGVFHPSNIVPAGCYDDSDDTLIDDKVDVTTLSQLLKYADEAQNESSVSATGSLDVFS